MAFNINEHKFVYNVAQCAGITTATYDEAMYQKIADWVNGDSLLGEMFTATCTLGTGTSYRTFIREKNGFMGINYGYYNSSYTGNTRCMLVRNSSDTTDTWTNDCAVYGSSAVYDTIDILKLQLIIFKGDYGYSVCFRDISDKTSYVWYICAAAAGEDGTVVPAVIGGTVYTAYTTKYYTRLSGVSTPSSYATPANTDNRRTRVSLQKIMIPSDEMTGYTADGVYFVYGAILTIHSVYEIDGGYYAIIADNSSSYAGLALRIG